LGTRDYRITHRNSYLVLVVEPAHCDARWHHVYLFWNAEHFIKMGGYVEPDYVIALET
jgi:hypothetical protein